jgi:hypothetical protein
MGVGLDAGLALDKIADELYALLDEGDLAAFSGDVDVLAAALAALAERLLNIRPFTPEIDLPANWRDVLRGWVSGKDVGEIGADNMKVVEDVFTYKLVWALEALRTRRLTQGWEPETIAGGAAAALETGVPNFMMSMLVRAGLPSRRAAIAAVEQGRADYMDAFGMREWLESDAVIALTETGIWPTPETAALWARFREEALSAAVRRWHRVTADRRIAGGVSVAPGTYRLEEDGLEGGYWLTTPDYQRVTRIQGEVKMRSVGVYAARVQGGSDAVEVEGISGGRTL